VKSQIVELGLLVGASNYIGDLSNEQIVFKETHPSVGIFGRYNINPKWALKGFAAFGSISGDDKNFISATRAYAGKGDVFEFNKYRNLNFTSDIYEFAVNIEYNLLKNDLTSNGVRPFIPYIFTGLAVFHFNPVSEIGGKKYELQPLGTEGQGTTEYNQLKKYSLSTISIPFGAGFRQRIGESFFIGVEAGVRIATTEYLDDIGGKYALQNIVSAAYGQNAEFLSDRSREVTADGSYMFTEGDRRSFKKWLNNDMYLIGGITFTYVIRGKGMACPMF